MDTGWRKKHTFKYASCESIVRFIMVHSIRFKTYTNVRDVEERVEPARAGEVDALGALGPRRFW